MCIYTCIIKPLWGHCELTVLVLSPLLLTECSCHGLESLLMDICQLNCPRPKHKIRARNNINLDHWHPYINCAFPVLCLLVHTVCIKYISHGKCVKMYMSTTRIASLYMTTFRKTCSKSFSKYVMECQHQHIRALVDSTNWHNLWPWRDCFASDFSLHTYVMCNTYSLYIC